tara:strand:+ start:1927 stop:2829 length:903 start_codon:yes stop_codon:yes gene_type:complete
MIRLRPETYAVPLKKGDEVIAVAPSSSISDNQSLIKGIEILEKWGLNCRPYNFIGRSWGYLAGNDEIRYKELHPEIEAPLTFCARGGWGSARLLERQQKWRNGWLVGYSDITSILLSRLSQGFDGGIHGPLLTCLSKEPEWSQERLKALLFGQPAPDLQGESWSKGISRGPLVVANLSVSTHLLGSRHIPDLKGAILIFEDTAEAPYRIDRMLTHWRLTGHLQKLSGIGFGNFNQCKEFDQKHEEDSFELEEIIKERCFDLGIPVVGRLPIGHCNGNASLPIGREARLDANQGKLNLLPS